MNNAQKYLLDNHIDDIVLNRDDYPENTTDNAEKWIYLSDVLEQYLAQSKLKNNGGLADVMGSFDHSIIDRIRFSQSDAEARRYIGTHLQNLP